LNYLLLALAILLKSTGNALGKQAGLATADGSIQSLIWNPYYLGMLGAYFLQALCWVLALRRFSLTSVYPFLSLSFLIDILSARVIFGETISLLHLLGMTVIFAGVLVMMTAPASTEGTDA